MNRETINAMAAWMEQNGVSGSFTGHGDGTLIWNTFPGNPCNVYMRQDREGFVWRHGSPRTGVSGIQPEELKAQVAFTLNHCL
jgi:hypothetical protein